MADSHSSGLTSRLAKLNPFSRSKLGDGDDHDDHGDGLSQESIAGGGRAHRKAATAKNQLRVSPALKSFLVDDFILPVGEVGLGSDEPTSALRALLDKHHISVPPELTDRSHPLPDYFISSSHNTYLLANQLIGTSSPLGYERALDTGSRCVEIDAWDDDDNKDEPKVTHGYTLVSHISFRSVCETIRDVLDKEVAMGDSVTGYRAAPIFLSLENHCSTHGQQRLVEIMTEIWGDRLLSKEVREAGHAEQAGTGGHVKLEELGSKIVMIVEFHLPQEAVEEDEDSEASWDGDPDTAPPTVEEQAAVNAYKAKKKEVDISALGIVPELAALGVYAQSVKPRDNSWYEQAKLTNGPHHHLINISETGLAGHLAKEQAREQIANHNAGHLMRVFPKGTRIRSTNLSPVPLWSVGAHICALNWQTFGAPLQLNEALFEGTDGYVLKPAVLRGQPANPRRRHLRLHIAGATDVPLPQGRKPDDIKPYVTCSLVGGDLGGKPVKRKTAVYNYKKLGDGASPAADPIWNETLEWEFEDATELVFLRILVKSDDAMARNPVLAVTAIRLLYLVPGWCFVRLLDLKGRETKCSVLIKFELEDL